jgi:hypothetical protein
MTIRKIITAVSAAVVLAPAAFGATTPAASTAPAAAPASTATPAAQCETLQKQYETAAAANSTNPNAAKAKKAADEGAKLCKEGKPADGVKKYEHAIKELGAKTK